MGKFKPAGVPEVLRSSQKDEQYLKYFKNLVTETIQKILGIPYWLKWKDLIDALACLTYYALTTVSGYQTLGEEYVYIVQVDPSLKKLPSNQKRLFFTILQSMGPVCLLYFQKSIDKKIQELDSNDNTLSGKRTAIKSVLKYAHFLFWLISFLQRFHLVLFYFNGAFYHISKRFAGIHYVMLRRWLGQVNSGNSWRILGYLTACQLCISVFLDIYSYIKSKNKEEIKDVIPSSSQSSAETSSCSLCLEKSKDTTLTPCGHVFCWGCITNWLQNKEECPLCREKFEPSRLVYLQNFC